MVPALREPSGRATAQEFANHDPAIGIKQYTPYPFHLCLQIVCNIYETWGIYGTYADQPRGTFIALVGSTGRLELAMHDYADGLED